MSKVKPTISFLDDLIATAVLLAEKQPSATWNQVASVRIGGKPVSDGEYEKSVFPMRSTVMGALKEAGYRVIPVNARYFNEPYDPAIVTTEDEARQFCAVVGHHTVGVGFHVVEDTNTDLLWKAWRNFNARKFGGGMASQAIQVLDAAKKDGSIEAAKDVLRVGFEAAVPPATVGKRIKPELDTTATKLLGETQR